jgi:hypothetical protein
MKTYGKQKYEPVASGRNMNDKPTVVQAKLNIGEPGDKYEQEAEATADKIMRMPDQAFLQRKCTECEEENKRKVQRKPLNEHNAPFIQTQSNSASAASESLSRKIKSSEGTGHAMDNTIQSFMNNRFGINLSDVKIHTDEEAAQLSRSLNAKAFTAGKDIYFNEGQYQPGTEEGKHLLAHELVHTVQQRTEHPTPQIQKYSTEDCSDNQRTDLSAAYGVAKDMLTNAINRLTANPVTVETKKLFAYHFGKYADWRRDVVVDIHYKKMQKILSDSEMIFECEKECDNEKAYTYWIFGDVHLCPGFFRSGVNEQAETIIHELFHLQGAFDLGYHKNNEDADRWWSAAINNADAFSELAQDLYEQP